MTASTSRRSSRRTAHRLVTLIPPAIFGLAAAVTLAGCPVGAELEDPERFGIGTGGTGPGTGGTGPGTGGTGPGTGGVAGSGTAGTAGSGTAGTAGGMLEVTCDGVDWLEVMNKNCANSGCHRPRAPSLGVADLNLTADANLVMRLKDVPAGFKEIFCGNVECLPETCPPAGTALLVNSRNPDESWLLKKLNGTHAECGLDMPQPAAGAPEFDAVRRACVEKVIRAIAAL